MKKRQIYPLFQISAGLSYSRLSDIIDLSCLLSTILLLAIANRGSGIFFLQERPGKEREKYSGSSSLKP